MQQIQTTAGSNLPTSSRSNRNGIPNSQTVGSSNGRTNSKAAR